MPLTARTLVASAALAAGCTRPDTGDLDDTADTAIVTGPYDGVVQVPCPEAAGDDGLAVWVRAPATPRYDDGTPVFVRVWADHKPGFDDVLPAQPALERGAALVLALEPGTRSTAPAGQSGDPVGESGAARVASVRCVVDYVNSAAFPVTPRGVVLTGVSFGGGPAAHAAVASAAEGGTGRGLDGTVLFEPPLVDQLVTLEPTPQRTLDPSFTPGTCTLAGCPFPGRGPALVWDGDLFHDLDADRARDDGEPVLALMDDPTGGSLGLPSLDLWDEVAANESTVFDAARPARWPTRESTAAFWAWRDATAALERARDDSLGRWLLVATEQDHVQVLHEHVRLGQAALSQAAWFRVNPGADALAEVGLPVDATSEPFATVPDPDAPGALPEGPDGLMTLAAELEIADRAHENAW